MTLLMNQKRGQVRVYLSANAKSEIDRLVEVIGGGQTDLLSRICERFAQLNKTEQLRWLGILGDNEEITEAKQNARRAG